MDRQGIWHRGGNGKITERGKGVSTGDLSVQGQKDGKMRPASPASHGQPNMVYLKNVHHSGSSFSVYILPYKTHMCLVI